MGNMTSFERKGNRLINTVCRVLYTIMILWIQTNKHTGKQDNLT